MDDFKSALEKQVQKAAVVSAPKLREIEPEETGWKESRHLQARRRNDNRFTVNLFEADRRYLSVIRELLANRGHDFTNRSDLIKIGLRLAAKARPEELSQIYQQIKSEDGRFRPL